MQSYQKLSVQVASKSWEITSKLPGKPRKLRLLTIDIKIPVIFRIETKWNTYFWSTQSENYQNNRFAWKGCPLEPVGTFQPVYFFLFTFFWVFHLAPGPLRDISGFFSDLTGNGKRMLRTGVSNRNLCVPFAQFETRWVFDVNGKQPAFQGFPISNFSRGSMPPDPPR